MSSDILPPRYPSPMPEIPRQSKAPLELLLQEIGDDEPTLKMQVPPHLLHQSMRPERRGLNYGMIGAILFCLAFWGSLIYLIFR